MSGAEVNPYQAAEVPQESRGRNSRVWLILLFILAFAGCAMLGFLRIKSESMRVQDEAVRAEKEALEAARRESSGEWQVGPVQSKD